MYTPSRLRPQDEPAYRGLVYWPGDGENRPRIIFGCGDWIYAVDPATGKAGEEFGRDGRTEIPTFEGKPLLYMGSRGGAEWSGAAVDIPTGRLYVTSNRWVSKITVIGNDELGRIRNIRHQRARNITTCIGLRAMARRVPDSVWLPR
jgi:hypothetical protein